MLQKLYNPCQDGFPAKVWECLRRNKEFEARIGDYFRATNEADAEDCWRFAYLDAEANQNRFAYQALTHLIGFDTEALSRVSLSNAWRELPDTFRKQLAASLDTQLPFRLCRPDFKEVSPFGEKFDERKSRVFLEELEEAWADHEIVAVPRWVLDNNHRREIFASLDRLVRKPAAAIKHLKPTGRSLGTNAEWNAFLLTETWRAKGCSFQQAADLATWEIYDPVSFFEHSEEFWLSAEGKGEAKKKAQKRGAKVAKDVRTIEGHIRSVFPEFMLFVT